MTALKKGIVFGLLGAAILTAVLALIFFTDILTGPPVLEINVSLGDVAMEVNTVKFEVTEAGVYNYKFSWQQASGLAKITDSQGREVWSLSSDLDQGIFENGSFELEKDVYTLTYTVRPSTFRNGPVRFRASIR